MSALFALLLAAAAPAPLPEAAPLGVKVRAEKTAVKLGEPFGYEIEIRHAPEEWYVAPAEPPLEPFRASGLRCARKDEPGTKGGKGETRTTCTMQLALFALGPNDVPALVLDVDGPGGKARLPVPGPRITAAGVLDPSAPPGSLVLRDIAPPAPLLVPTWRPLLWAVGALAAVGAALGVWVVIRRLRARRPATPPPSPAERFARRLAAIEAEDLPRRGRGAEHVERLAEAVREYLAALTGVPALDLTTREILDALAREPRPDARLGARFDLGGLEVFLGQADLVKFARLPAAPETCAAALEYAHGLLHRTRPPPPQEAAG